MSVKGLEESEKLAAKITNDVLKSLRKQKAEIADQLAKTKYLLADPEALKGWRTSLAAEDRRTALLSMMTDVERLYLEAGDSEAASIFKKRMRRELMRKMTNLKANELEVKIRTEKLKAQTRSKVLAGLNEVKQDAALREVYAQSRAAGGCLSGMFGRPFMRDLVTFETKSAGSKTLGQYMQKLYRTYEAGLRDVFVKGIIRGDSFQTMEQNLIRSTGVTAGKAKLLVRTESNAIMNDTVRQVIDSNPLVKGYRFRAVLDSRTSKICQEHDGEYIPKDQAKPGVNYPPLHPNCRSTVTTVLFNESEREDTMQRYTKNGSNTWIKVKPGMTYKEFKETVAGTAQYSRTLSDGRSVTREVYIDPNDRRIVYAGTTRIVPGVAGSAAVIDGTMSSKASAEASRIYNAAKLAEPRITDMMQAVAAKKGSRLAGVEFSVKTASSLEGKVRRDIAEALRESGKAPEADYEVISKMNDIVRYTVQSEHDEIVQNVEETLRAMEERGIEVIRLDNKYTKVDPEYKDVKLVARDGQTLFEVQFHSPESLAVKDAIHVMYEKQRVLDPADPEYRELHDQMVKISSKVKSPKGIERLVSFRK